MIFPSLELILTCSLFSGFGTLQFKHAQYAKDNFSEQPNFIKILQFSAGLQNLAGLYILYIYFSKTSILSALTLFIITMFSSPFVHMVTTVKLFGFRNASLLGFIGWPIMFAYLLHILEMI